MYTMKRKVIENIIYLLLWCTFLFFPIIILGGTGNLSWARILLEWVRLVPFLIFFILHNNLLIPNFLFNKKISIYVCGVVFSTILVLMLFPICKEIQFVILPDEPPRPLQGNGIHRGFFFIKNLSDKLLFMLLILSFNLSLKYFFRQQEKLRQEEAKGKEMLRTELNFLKNQISPHFFMNTLNNIHALIDYDPDAAKETIISLSKLMRHILYDAQSRTVSIKKEMNFINSYVELMRLKLSNRIPVSCSIPDELPDKSVPPLIFTSLIENAFKHGVSLKEKSYINIIFSFPYKDRMECRITNSNHPTIYPTGHKGIGLENTKRRLDIEFPSAYQLNIYETEKEFTVILNIPI